MPFQPDFGIQYSPVWSPDGKYLLFIGAKTQDPNSYDWWVAPLDGGPAAPTGVRRPCRSRRIHCCILSPGRAITSFLPGEPPWRGSTFFATTISPEHWHVSDKIQQITRGTGICWDASVANDGRVLFSNLTPAVDAWEIALDPEKGTTSEQRDS